MPSALDMLFVYQFIKRLVIPFKDTQAFKLGIIDDRGRILKKMKDLKTPEEKKAYTYRDRLMWNLKRVLELVPIMRNKLASYAAALYLLKEDLAKKTDLTCLYEEAFFEYYGLNGKVITEETKPNVLQRGVYRLKSYIGEIEENVSLNCNDIVLVLNDSKPIGESLGFNIYKALHLKSESEIFVPMQILEDMGAGGIVNAVGTGSHIAGVTGDPPGKPKKKYDALRRSTFAGVDVFEVDEDTFDKATNGSKEYYARWNKYINIDEKSPEKEIYEYAKKYPNKGIILQHKKYGTMQYLRHKK